MSESAETPAVVKEPEQLHGLLAEYTTPEELLQAARRVKDAGYSRWDTFSPFPVHGIDPAMGIKRTVLPWIVLVAGLTGGSLALFFQWWTSSVDYRWIVSGKPFWSIPANIPITFELTVLFAALSCFVSMLVLNKLPLPSHPLDRYKRFARVTNDRFFVLIQASDPRFDRRETAKLLDATNPRAVEAVMEDTASSATLPRGVIYGLVMLASAATVPFALAMLARVSTSERPRVHIVPDMDWQEKFKAQRENHFFEDKRAMRLDVAGTVAQGELRDDDHFYRGKVGGAFAKTFPAQVDISMQTMERGRERFGVYCTPCHGVDGGGQGMVHQRARALLQGTWVPPTDLHQENLAYKSVGELFDSMSRGIRNMPPYARQIDTADRWAIVLYLRALQRSGAAKLEDVPESERGGLK
ncbi:MAG TPA: quinol:electron acceptor oxidoreductase subunit ActD [Polyangiaceae bacterium]|nr:quinol:electron acceptor oxidoreductase subunit ActD [Polyangiaceae bacterium]